MKNIKVYISQRMHDIEDGVIRENRAAILKDVEYFLKSITVDYDDIEVVNRLAQEPGHERTWYLGNSISTMEKADLIIFAKDWRFANGCQVEHVVVDKYYKQQFNAELIGAGNISEIWWDSI